MYSDLKCCNCFICNAANSNCSAKKLNIINLCCALAKGHSLSNNIWAPRHRHNNLHWDPDQNWEISSMEGSVVASPQCANRIARSCNSDIHIAYSVTEPHFFKHSLYSCHGPHKTKGKYSRYIEKLGSHLN